MTPEALETADFAIPWARIALVLLLTVGATVALAACAKGLQARPRAGRGRMLSLVDVLSLGPQRSLFVVAAGGRQLLLAATPQGVTSLGELGPAPLPAPAAPPATEAVSAPEPVATSSPLVQLLGDEAPRERTPSPFDRVLQAVRSFDERIGRTGKDVA